MLRHFIGVWLIYWAVVALLPVHSIYPSTGTALAIQGGFVLLVAVALIATRAILGPRQMPPAGKHDIASAASIVRLSLVLSAFGLAALTYDKLFVQGIDYSEGVAAAREEWRRLGEEREGAASSGFSAVGYLFGSAYYVALVVAATQRSALTARQRLQTLLACFAFTMANSAITGGRSNILLVAAFLIAAIASRRDLHVSGLVAGGRQSLIVRVLAALALAYTVFIFYQRAQTGDDAPLQYALDFLPFLGVEVDTAFRDILDDGPLSSLSAMIVLSASYMTHSFATVAAIADAVPEDKTIIFLHAAGILNKLGIGTAPNGDWFLAGRFPSLPGALWHQFGFWGYAVGSLLIGVASAAAAAWTARRPERLLPLGVFVMADTVLLMSPDLFAGDFLAFPFVAGSFFMLAAWSKWVRPRRSGSTGSERTRELKMT